MKIGTRVKHSAYGTGTVCDFVNGKTLIAFDCILDRYIPGIAIDDLDIIGIAPEFLEEGHIITIHGRQVIVDDVKILATQVIITTESGISRIFPRYQHTVNVIGKRPS